MELYLQANVKLAKKYLKDVTEKVVQPRYWKEQIKEIQKCIVKCKKEKIPNSADEMISANTMLVFLTCKDSKDSFKISLHDTNLTSSKAKLASFLYVPFFKNSFFLFYTCIHFAKKFSIKVCHGRFRDKHHMDTFADILKFQKF
jgi:hypothetical protein